MQQKIIQLERHEEYKLECKGDVFTQRVCRGNVCSEWIAARHIDCFLKPSKDFKRYIDDFLKKNKTVEY